MYSTKYTKQIQTMKKASCKTFETPRRHSDKPDYTLTWEVESNYLTVDHRSLMSQYAVEKKIILAYCHKILAGKKVIKY